MTEIFSSTVTNNMQGVFGELNVAIDQNVYEMQYSTNIRAKIMEKGCFNPRSSIICSAIHVCK